MRACLIFLSITYASAQVELSKTDVQTAFQTARCCSKTYPTEVAEACVASIGDIYISQSDLLDAYTESGCCGATDCTVTLDSCPLCEDSFDDLYSSRFGKQRTTSTTVGGIPLSVATYYQNGTSVSQNFVTGVYAESTVAPRVVTRTGDMSWRATTIERPYQIPGCNGLQGAQYIEDYPGTECADYSHVVYFRFDTEENLDACAAMYSTVGVLKIGALFGKLLVSNSVECD